jgi:YVTN family beta-propeller protein
MLISLTTMKRYFGSLRYLWIWILLARPLAASTARIYVVNGAGDTVDVIDPVTNRVVQVIKDMEKVHGLAVSPDGSRVYITQEFENVLDVVDRKTGEIIKKVPLSGRPNLPVVTKDGRRVFVCIGENPPVAGVDIIDTTSLEKVKTIAMKGYMHDIYLTPDGKYAVAGSPGGKFAAVIDVQTEEPAWEIQFDKRVQTMAVESGPDGSTSRIFVQLYGLNGFAVVDFAKHEEVARIKFPDIPCGCTVPGSLSHGSRVAPDGKTFWLNSRAANSVFVYSLPELKLLGHVALPELKLPGKTLAVGANSDWITFTPDGKTVYVSNTWLNSVSVIDAKTLKVVANIPVGERPQRVETLALP